MIPKSEMKVYRSSSKIKKLVITMLGGKFVECRSGFSSEQIVGICILLIASLVQCIGATGTFSSFYHRIRDYASERRNKNSRKENFLEFIVEHVN